MSLRQGLLLFILLLLSNMLFISAGFQFDHDFKEEEKKEEKKISAMGHRFPKPQLKLKAKSK